MTRTKTTAPNIHTNVHKIIIGVDYGTTYTGVGYVTTTNSDTDNVSILTNWPGTGRCSETVFKIPSRIAYPNENPNIQNEKWGFQVQPGMFSYSWTKLLLDENAPAAKFDDETLAMQAVAGMPVLGLPPDKGAVDVASDFLEKVYKHTMYILGRQISEETLAMTPLEFWFTMPAIWSDEAQSATKEAALRAGFASNPADRIFMIREPEAAAIAALKEFTSQNPLARPQEGEGILVCDCGGGTVDITTYSIISVSPKLKFEEMCPGIGAKCGSTTIDRAFYQLMLKRFGDAFGSLPLRLRGPGSEFMDAFERIKQNFGSPEDVELIYELPLNMILQEADPKYFDEDERLVRISKRDLQMLFDPVVDSIKTLIAEQMMSVKSAAQNSKINKIILVGGFGDSEYLRSALKKEFNNIKIIMPKHPQAAIVKGAVIGGLDGTRPVARRCRRHYGFLCCKPFKKGLDRDDDWYIDPISESPFANHVISWVVKKGEKLDEATIRTDDLIIVRDEPDSNLWYVSLPFYQCDQEDPPRSKRDSGVRRVGKLYCDMSEVDPKLIQSKIDSNGEAVYWLDTMVRVHFGAETGVLRCETIVDGKSIGETYIDFTKK